MAEPSDEIEVSLTNLRASRYPLLRRMDQQFALENKFSDYQKEISRVRSINKAALSSVSYQERRLREMQAMLRSSSPIQGKSVAHEHHQIRPETNTAACHRHQSQGIVEERKSKQTIKCVKSDLSRAVTTEKVSSLTHTKDETPNQTIQITSVPDAPMNFMATEIGHDSFTVVWDPYVVEHDATIVDYEIRYSHSVDGKQNQVLQRCSRWILKDPVPNGRFVVQNLEPNTEYQDIAIRCRNHVGWSAFSNPIKCLTTVPKGEKSAHADGDYKVRRGKFLFRIGYLEQSIKSLETSRRKIPAQQVLLARKMSRTQDERILGLNEEVERVSREDDNALLSSHLLHGATQMFTKRMLKRKLEQEVVICREDIAQWRAEIVDMGKESCELAAEINKKKYQLKERKAALHKFDQQHAIVSGMKILVSKQPTDLKKYYIALWKSRVADRTKVRKTLNALARSCRRRICAGAWRQLCTRVSSGLETARIGTAHGIGGVLLNFSEQCIHENLTDASHLIEAIGGIKESQSDEVAVIHTCPTHLLCEEDKDSLKKGDFLFNVGHYESSLKSFQLVLSKMERSRDYFSGMSSADSAALYSEVNGKIGHAHIKLGLFDLAIVYFGRQLSLAEEEDLEVSLTCALLGLGMCYHEKFDHLYAESFFKRALDLCISRGDEARKLISYACLQKCCECQNRPIEAAAFAEKIQKMDNTSWHRESGGAAVSRRGVDKALQDLDSMNCRLIDVTAKNSRVVKLEVASAHRVQLQRAQADKEKQLREAFEHLAASKELSEELQELLDQIEYEIHEAKHTKKNRIKSLLLQGSAQEVKASELMFRLEGEKSVVQEKLEDCLAQIPETKMRIYNTQDDITVLDEELHLENGALMQHILRGRKYRCVSLNAANTCCDDVIGASSNGVSCVALSEGESCYIHCLNSGKLKHAFVGDEEGSTATITSVFFYANRVYTGTMDSVIVGWDISSSKKLFVAKGHESAVTCIHADAVKIVSGSADKSIIVWNCDGTLLRRVCGHSRGVHCIQCGPSWCISASYDTVFVWDILTDKETYDIKGFNCRCRLVQPEGNVTALQYGELEVITGNSLGAISVWWIESGELLHSFKAHDCPLSALQVDATKAISVGLDMIVVSDIIRGEVVHTLRGHTAPILAVAFDRTQIISASTDGELRYWSWENPSRHSKADKKSRQNGTILRANFGGNKIEDAIEGLTAEEDYVRLSDSRSRSRGNGALMNRLAGKIALRRSVLE